MYGFLDFVMTGKEVGEVVNGLQYKATKKKVFSFERLNLMIMPMFKFLESEKT